MIYTFDLSIFMDNRIVSDNPSIEELIAGVTGSWQYETVD